MKETTYIVSATPIPAVYKRNNYNPDFTVQQDGSLFLLKPRTEAALVGAPSFCPRPLRASPARSSLSTTS